VKSTSEHLSATPVQCDHSKRDLTNKEFNSIQSHSSNWRITPQKT